MVVLLDGDTITKEEIPSLEKENIQLKQTIYQLDILYKNYIILCMVLIGRLGEKVTVTEEELKNMRSSNQGLKVETDTEEETATFSIQKSEEEQDKNDESQPDSEKDIEKEIPKEERELE